MAYSKTVGNDFWFEFDNAFMWNPSQEAIDALTRAFTFSGLGFTLDRTADLLRASYGTSTHPADFIAGLSANRQGLVEVADLQWKIIQKHLANRADIQAAFEDFAQGVLFDQRRNVRAKIHKMDGDPEHWVGYHRWSAFARILQLFGHQPDDWLHLHRCLGLAWAIQSEARPQEDDPSNPGLSATRLAMLRTAWISVSVSTLDWAFTSHRTVAPTPEELAARSASTAAVTGYARVQQILENATPTGNPSHGGQRRFWLKSYTDFIGLSIYGQQLIADPGANRGANSALVKVLQGTLTGFPRMPKAPLPPVNPTEIKEISDWIDSGANEF